MDRILSPHHTTRFITNKNGMERSGFQAGLPASSAVCFSQCHLPFVFRNYDSAVLCPETLGGNQCMES